MVKKKAKFDRKCVLCKKRRAIYSIQRLLTGNGKLPRPNKVQVIVVPHLCMKCVKPHLIPNLVVATDYNHVKKLLSEICNGDMLPTLVVLNRKAMELHEAEVEIEAIFAPDIGGNHG